MQDTLHFGLSLCPEVGRWRDTVAQAQLAEELGYDSIWLPEHHLMAGYAPAPLIALAGLVEATRQITLGTDVLIAPFYHPVRLAEECAQLSDMSEGRFIAGVGLGYRPEEFAAYGIPFKDRAGRLEEGLQIVRKLWQEEGVSFQGQYFSFSNTTIYPRLASPPPLWIGGWTEKALRRAARLGDAWFPGPTANITKLHQCLDIYDRALAEEHKQRTILPIFREIWVADSPEMMEAGVVPLRKLYADDYVSWQHANVDSTTDVATDRFLIGDPETVAQGIIRLQQELGITHLIARLHFHGIAEEAVEAAMHLLAQQVRPMVERALTFHV